jgi:uncharacterized protein YjbI with pentapeptide repeats
MKTVKDDTLSFLTQVFLFRGSAHLSVGVIAGFTLEEKPEFLPEADLLGIIKDGLDKDTIFDPGMPKPLGEALAAGKCFAPGGKPVPAILPSFRVGPVRKSLAVFGNRFWKHLGGVKTEISEPEPFTAMELSWKRAFGGPEYEANPDGAGMIGDPVALPNIEQPDRLIGAPGDLPAPAGFEPLGMAWPGRLKGLGTFDQAWVRNIWPAFPDDYTFLYFNRAPADQRIEGWFRGDEPVEVDHLHPEHTHIRSRLPGVRSRCFAIRTENGEELFAEIEMRLETVWLIPNSLTGVLIWRGVTAVSDDEASNTPLLAAFTEPLDAHPETLEFYLEKVRTMQAGETGLAAAEAPAGEEKEAPGRPGMKTPGIPGREGAAPAVTTAGIAGTAGWAVPAIGEEVIPPEAALPGAVSGIPAAETTETAAIPELPLIEGVPQPIIARSVEEIPKIEIPELPPPEEKYSPTDFEKKTEITLKESLQIPPDQPLFPEPPPLPEMTPEALQTYMESLATQTEAEARRFFERHDFNPDAPVEIPPASPEAERMLYFDPIPENVPVGQIPSLLRAQSQEFQKRFDDLAKKYSIDPYALAPEDGEAPFVDAAGMEKHLRRMGYSNPDFFEELHTIDILQKEADARLDQYLAVLGTSRKSLASGAEKEAGKRREQEAAADAEIQDFITQLAAGTVPGLTGAASPVAPSEQGGLSSAGGESASASEEDFPDDQAEEDTAPRPEPPAREEILKRLEAGESLAGCNLAGADLTKADFSNCDLRGTDFSGANLEKTNFSNSDLTGALLSGAILTGAVFAGGVLKEAKLMNAAASGANFTEANLFKADLSRSDFSGANFTGAFLSKTTLDRASFNEAKMAGFWAENTAALRTEFIGAELTGARFSGADLTEADFSAANIERADFSGATVAAVWFSHARASGAVFRDANLRNSRSDRPVELMGADFCGANLTDARWQDADFSGAKFITADFSNALFTGCRFEGADISEVMAPNADFRKSSLVGATAAGLNLFKGSLRKTELIETDFTGANLYGVDFYQANVVRSLFNGALLEGTLLAGWRPT